MTHAGRPTADAHGHEQRSASTSAGTGIKGAPVDLADRRAAGRPAAHRDAAAVHARRPSPRWWREIVEHFGQAAGDGPVGVTFPAVILHGVVRSAANIDTAWIGTDVDALIDRAARPQVHVVNDADAAGVAEARYGAARGVGGVVVVATLGTGIGTALLARRAARAQHRARPPGDRRPRRRVAGGVDSAREREDLTLGGVGERACSATSRRRRGPALAGPDRRRRRGQQEERQVPAAAAPARPDRAGDAAQRRRDRRRRRCWPPSSAASPGRQGCPTIEEPVDVVRVRQGGTGLGDRLEVARAPRSRPSDGRSRQAAIEASAAVKPSREVSDRAASASR